MPAYFSIEVSFKKNILYPSFVKEIYSVFFQSGFEFKSGYWFGEDMTLEQIIEWNQKHLQNKFRLGFTQHVKYDYKQMLLDTDVYSEMRLCWMYLNDRIHLHLIIPEVDVLHLEESYSFLEDKINPLLITACEIWDTGLASVIQSCLEFDEGGIDIEELKQDQLPLIHPFCILDKDIAQRFISTLKSNLICQSLNNNGILIIDNSLLKR